MILQAVVGSFVLDALFGDPAWLPHPVVLMGRCISRLEKFLRVLVRAGAGGKGPCAGEQECVRSAY